MAFLEMLLILSLVMSGWGHIDSNCRNLQNVIVLLGLVTSEGKKEKPSLFFNNGYLGHFLQEGIPYIYKLSP